MHAKLGIQKKSCSIELLNSPVNQAASVCAPQAVLPQSTEMGRVGAVLRLSLLGTLPLRARSQAFAGAALDPKINRWLDSQLSKTVQQMTDTAAEDGPGFEGDGLPDQPLHAGGTVAATEEALVAGRGPRDDAVGGMLSDAPSVALPGQQHSRHRRHRRRRQRTRSRRGERRRQGPAELAMVADEDPGLDDDAPPRRRMHAPPIDDPAIEREQGDYESAGSQHRRQPHADEELEQEEDDVQYLEREPPPRRRHSRRAAGAAPPPAEDALHEYPDEGEGGAYYYDEEEDGAAADDPPRDRQRRPPAGQDGAGSLFVHHRYE